MKNNRNKIYSNFYSLYKADNEFCIRPHFKANVEKKKEKRRKESKNGAILFI